MFTAHLPDSVARRATIFLGRSPKIAIVEVESLNMLNER